MARARNIKPGFFMNELIAELPFEFRLLFIGLWTVADREGRLEYRPLRIKAAVLPYDNVSVEDGIAALIERGFIFGYERDEHQYLQIINWSKHQNPHHKEIASVIPSPPGHRNSVCDGYIPLNNTIRRRIYERDGRKCRACGATHGLSIDHIKPISKGGNSIDDNLQVLCMGCNFSKGNKTLTMHESCTTHAKDVDDSSKTLLVPLIPDSLIPDSLIPDSLIPDSLIPDSLIPDSLIPDPLLKPFATAAIATALQKAKPKTKVEPPTGKTWTAYAGAYRRRYGVEPVRNGKVNGQLAQLINRLGADEAPAVAAFYVSHNKTWYVSKKHPVDSLLADAEGLRTEWATGRMVTDTEARQTDNRQSNFNSFAPLIEEARAREENEKKTRTENNG